MWEIPLTDVVIEEEDLSAVAECLRLLSDFELAVNFQQFRVGTFNSVRSEDGTERAEEPGLPIDERSIAIEGDAAEKGKV